MWATHSRQVLVCACGVSFSIGAPLPGCAWLAVLRWRILRYGRRGIFNMCEKMDNIQQLKAYFIEINSKYRLDKKDQPVINNGYYSGQGFGRLFEHALRTCLFAGYLGRPFLLDLHNRDPYHILQSYITIGDINWIPDKNIDVKKMALFLEKDGDGEIEPKNMNLQNVIPMYMKDKCDLLEKDRVLELWKSKKDKILYSPNWGTGWFPHLTKYMYQFYQNKFNIEDIREHNPYNLLFRLTERSESLFQEKKKKILGENFNDKYGSIHVRTWFFRGKISDIDLSNSIKSSINLFPEINKWWLVGDNISTIKFIKKNITKICEGYDDEFTKYSKHSCLVTEDPNNYYSHRNMETSILDWVAICKSDVAIITDGAFGETAASGWNSKVMLLEDNKRLTEIRKHSKVPFRVYSNL
jgi:hypothetical protein